MIKKWFQCPICGKGGDEIGWEVDFEHIVLECRFCGSVTKQNISGKDE